MNTKAESEEGEAQIVAIAGAQRWERKWRWSDIGIVRRKPSSAFVRFPYHTLYYFFAVW
jgi:hypothetical protein